MSDSEKRTQKPSDDSVDWAEKLKASMNAEAPVEEPHIYIPDEEDDLAALLRAQLAKKTSTEPEYLDTSEFEDDDVDLEADDPVLEDEYLEDEEDDPALEEEYSEDEEDDLALEEEYPEDEEDDLAPEDEYSEDEEDDLALEEEYPEDEEDDPEIESEPPVVAALPAGYVTDPEVLATLDVRPSLDEKLRWDDLTPAESTGTVTLDGLLNGAAGKHAASSDRLRALDEENDRILRETAEQISSSAEAWVEPTTTTDPWADEDCEVTPSDSPESAMPTVEPAPKPYRRVHPITFDPLQLGLDEPIRPTPPPPPPPLPEPTGTELLDEEMPVGGRIDHRPAMPHHATKTPYTERMAPPGTESTRDTELYIGLGYETELRHAEQQARVEQAHAADAIASAERPVTDPAVARHGEYTGHDRTAADRARFLRARRDQLFRLIVAAVGALVALMYDLLPTLLGAIDKNVKFVFTPAYPLVGLVWILLICLPFFGRLFRSARGLLDFRPTRYSVTVLGAVVASIHALVAVIAALADKPSPTLFGGAALAILALTALSEYLATRGEHAAFEVVSSGKPSFTMTDEPTPASRAADSKAPTEWSAVPIGRLADFFARTGRYNPYMSRLNYLLPMALLSAIVCAGISVALGGHIVSDGLRVFTATYLACLPAAYLVALCYPLCLANQAIAEQGTAVVGTAAPTDHVIDSATRVFLRDGDVLVAVNRKEITLRDDPRASEWRRIATRLFCVLGSPLAVDDPLDIQDRLALSTLHAEIDETGEQYVKLYLIDEDPATPGERSVVEVMMGSHEALSRRGVRLPKRSMEQAYKKSEDSHVLYLAFDGAFCIAYAVEYRPSRSAQELITHLRAAGATVTMSTYDPFITQSLMRGPRTEDPDGVEPVRPDYVETLRKVRSGGVIATGRASDLRYPLFACQRMRLTYIIAHALTWGGVVAAAALAILSVALGHGTLLVSPLVVAGHVVAGGISLLVSRLTVSRRALGLDEPTEKTPRTR